MLVSPQLPSLDHALHEPLTQDSLFARKAAGKMPGGGKFVMIMMPIVSQILLACLGWLLCDHPCLELGLVSMEASISCDRTWLQQLVLVLVIAHHLYALNDVTQLLSCIQSCCLSP